VLKQPWRTPWVEYAQQTPTLTRAADSKCCGADKRLLRVSQVVETRAPGTRSCSTSPKPVGGGHGEGPASWRRWWMSRGAVLRFGGLGIYGLERHPQARHEARSECGRALALRFGFYAPFETLVPRQALLDVATGTGCRKVSHPSTSRTSRRCAERRDRVVMADGVLMSIRPHTRKRSLRREDGRAAPTAGRPLARAPPSSSIPPRPTSASSAASRQGRVLSAPPGRAVAAGKGASRRIA